MKKIIKGKVYDTATAKLVGQWSSNYARTDFYFFEEKLYQKKTGEFFLYGIGNAASPYNEYSYGSYTGGEKIVPMSYEEAREWAERKFDADDYIKLFGESEDDDSGEKQYLSLYLPSATVSKAKREAGKKGVPVSEYIAKLIES